MGRTAWKRIGLLLVALMLVAAGWIAARLWEYQRLAPVREGISALKSGDYELALKRIKPFAIAGDELAQRTLGEMYAFGLGVPLDDVQARIWFRRAECVCMNTGQFEYDTGVNYLEGYAGKRDAGAALKWIQNAATAGHPTAQRMLAERTTLGEKGITVDPDTAAYWKRVLASETR